jgi:plastocyanin
MKKLVSMTLVSIALGSSLFAAEHIIEQKKKKFIPSSIEVKVGDTIRFKNYDPFAHNAYTDDEANEFDIGMQSTNQDAVVTIKAAGEFNIECAIHPNMLLKVKAK